ncbi:hypothetical protein EON81_27810 [bacterium]|nr:MAG: hypothetical protein EON81_27810 [bacterium]
MDKQKPSVDNSEGMAYVRSLRDPVKRRFGAEYLAWIRSGKTGAAPSRANLSPTLGRAVQTNLDSLG